MTQARDSANVEDVKGVGEAVAKLLRRLGVYTVNNLLHFFPRTYDDYSKVSDISDLQPGPATIKATISHISGRYVRRGMHITEAVAKDGTDSVRLVWFNQPYREKSLQAKSTYYISGEFGLHGRYMNMINPAIELEKELQLHAGRIVPVYRQTKGLTSTKIRTLIKACLPDITALPEVLPKKIITEHKLLPYNEAVKQMHFPSSAKSLANAKKRLGFQEVFELAFAAALNRQLNAKENSLKVAFDEVLAKKFVAKLPFPLTNAQRKAAWQILQDMNGTTPMNRMLEGDVGSGKTVVAAMAAFMAVKKGYQVAVMAPTEVLARQLHANFKSQLKLLGLEDKVCLLVGSQKKSIKEDTYQAIAAKSKDIVIGTHALIQSKVDMKSLGLVVIDEQHRFGVKQRELLLKKAGQMPHVLTMTATPIPRSLALTLYGELDISVLDEKPRGRRPIATEICSPNSRSQLVAKVLKSLEQNEQVFIVCPLIEDSEAIDAESAEKVYTRAKSEYRGYAVGLLHGKMKAADKEVVMQQFVDGGLNVLVSTTVIEVGVDVPNATVMIIESAERFGLAQLHQLRGRVGRSSKDSFCYLMLSDSKQPPRRLRALQSTHDGFKLAQLDLELRGPGAIYGHMQHGELDLRVASLTDAKLIASAKTAADYCIENGETLVQYKQLVKRVQKYRAITNLN